MINDIMKILKNIVFVFLLSFVFNHSSLIYASDYVLPYPSYMPGNKLYKVTRIIDELKRFWYFGNIAQVKYHLGLSDKYLVEAKTLMEYGQYLLGADALKRSDKEFMMLPEYLSRAKSEGVDISKLIDIVAEAAAKHESVLVGLSLSVPETFTWTPEKAATTELQPGRMLHSSLDLRISIASRTASL
jgi:hypothetical protein